MLLIKCESIMNWFIMLIISRLSYFGCANFNWVVIINGTSAHWAKNRGQKDINSKIVEKGKILNSLDGFQSPFMNQNHLKYFCYRF